MGFFATAGSSILLFCLVFGMSATVELKQLRKQMTNATALLIGVSMQFVLLPFVGFLVVKAFQLPAAVGITLLVVTSSPGGSYSNWWCSLFNAELSLSVTMTALSTLLSTIMLPTNLVLYTQFTYSADVIASLDWTALFVSLIVVLSGIGCGLIASSRAAAGKMSSHFHRRANLLGNLAGLSLITLSATVSSTGQEASVWNQHAWFYIAVAIPAVTGLALATYMTTKLDLAKPERVAVAVESCYQNTGIATSVALTMFGGKPKELATAIGVPLFYGMVEAILLACFCITCWKMGWTKAPADENLCVVLYNSYEVEEQDWHVHGQAIEIVLGSNDEKHMSQSPHDLIFAQLEDGSGAYVVDTETLDKIRGGDHNDDNATHSDWTDRTGEDGSSPPPSTWYMRKYRRVPVPAPNSPTGRSYTSGSTSSSSNSTTIPVARAVVVVHDEDDDEDVLGVNNEEQVDAATMILAMEERQVRSGGVARALATLRARATGYAQAPTRGSVASLPTTTTNPALEEEDEFRSDVENNDDHDVLPVGPLDDDDHEVSSIRKNSSDYRAVSRREAPHERPEMNFI